MKRACTDCGKVGNRLGDLCKACAIGAPEDLTAGRWVSRHGVQVWQPQAPEVEPPKPKIRRGRPRKVVASVVVAEPTPVAPKPATDLLATLVAERNDCSWFTRHPARWDDNDVATARRRRDLADDFDRYRLRLMERASR